MLTEVWIAHAHAIMNRKAPSSEVKYEAKVNEWMVCACRAMSPIEIEIRRDHQSSQERSKKERSEGEESERSVKHGRRGGGVKERSGSWEGGLSRKGKSTCRELHSDTKS